MLKRIIALILISILSICFFSVALAENNNINYNSEYLDDSQTAEEELNKAITFLLQIGYTEDYIRNASNSKLINIYHKIKDKNVILLDRKTTVSEFPSDISAPLLKGYIGSQYLIFETTQIAEINSSKRILSILVFTEYKWKQARPSVRKTDAIAVNWDREIFEFQENSFESYDESGDFSGDTNKITNVTTHNHTNRPTEIQQGGLGYYIPLVEGNTEWFGATASGYSSFILKPKITMYTGARNVNSKPTTINAQITHKKSILSPNFSFSVLNFGVSIATDGVNYDETSASSTIYYNTNNDVSETSIELNKSTFYSAEEIDIAIRNNKNIDAWVGIYKSGVTDYKNNATGMWRYVGTATMTRPSSLIANNTIKLTAQTYNITQGRYYALAPGNYKIVLFSDNDYTVELIWDIVIEEAKMDIEIEPLGEKNRPLGYSIKIHSSGVLRNDAWIGLYYIGSDGNEADYGQDYPSLVWNNINSENGLCILNYTFSNETPRYYKIILFGDGGYTPLCKETIYLATRFV